MGDAALAYGVVEMPYRDPASAQALPPPDTFDSNAARAVIPQRPGAGTPVDTIGRPKMTPVTMLDGRKLLEAGEIPDIDRHAFLYAQQETAFRAWNDPAAVRDEYLPEIEALVRARVPGADHPESKVLIFDHALRTGGQSRKEEEQANPDAGWGGCACPLPRSS